MNQILKEKLEHLNDDELMIEAIQVSISQTIELENPKIEPGDTNEIIGEKYRAYSEAKKMFNKAVIDIKSHKSYRDKPSNFNKAK